MQKRSSSLATMRNVQSGNQRTEAASMMRGSEQQRQIPNMGRTLRVLNVEDSEEDLALLARHLQRAGYDLTTDRVETAEAMKAALESSEWDVILCDYSMPQFNALPALSVVKEMGLDIPFIIISGTVGEAAAVEAMRAGAHDYLMKDNLVRLVPTIERELHESENRRARRHAEEAQRASELRYRRLFESAKDGILILDAVSGQIVDVNPFLSEMLGFSKQELAGKELWQIGAFKGIVASKLAFAELREQGYIRYENLPLKTRAGLVKQVEFVSNSYLAGAGRVIQCNIRDITERKVAEEDLRRTNQRLEGALAELQTKTQELASMTQQLWQASKLATMGELAASIAHELNNPLATVALRAEALMGELPPDDPRFHSVKIISQEVERMATLVGNLLKFSRRSQLEISTLDLREELADSLDFIEHYLRSNKVDVVRDFASELPSIPADRQQLRQVFLNLITNASDAMPRGGTLTVRAFSGVLGAQPAVIVEFSDTGTGIKTGDLPKLWEPFFTTKPEGKGTGLGLAICRRTVEGHHGIIEIETGSGKGATVRITLPAPETEESGA